MPPGRAPGESGRFRGSSPGVSGRPPGAPFAGVVPGVRRRRPPGLGSAGAGAATRAGLQVPDSRERWPRVSAFLAASLLHIYGRLSHCLAVDSFQSTGARSWGSFTTGGGAEGTPPARASARRARCLAR
uniref:Uncharacterized protein n=1 Tax=Sciurus vulgaris TaxID=55149 RepID=A0A8D2AZ40_SCIVU